MEKLVNRQIWMGAFIVLAMVMVGLPEQVHAQTYEQAAPLNVRYSKSQDSMMAARAASARAARARGAAMAPRSRAAGVFVTFDAPNSGVLTLPTALSASGNITGHYLGDSAENFKEHGFLRLSTGAFVNVDVPGAMKGTFPVGLNDDGAVVGYYLDRVGSGQHSFLRKPDGTISTFDPPVSNIGSLANAVNPDGTIVGSYYDANFVSHGFLRTSDGKITTFDAPGATSPFGTVPSVITPEGMILGYYGLGSGLASIPGFLLIEHGPFSQIVGPGKLAGEWDPFNYGPALSIDRYAEIAGTYFAPISGNPFGGNFRAFVRSPDGTYVAFDAATYPPCCIWTAASGINDAGTVTGSFNDGYNVYHGFWKTRRGSVHTFDVPGAGTGNDEGSVPIGITLGGVIAGWYRDASQETHGFLFTPYPI